MSTGLLTYSIEDEIAHSLYIVKIGAEEISPIIDILNKDAVCHLKEYGLSVRPWGINNYDKMEKAYPYSINGMTVNFPDNYMILFTERRANKNVQKIIGVLTSIAIFLLATVIFL